jgi:hypothetical protein
MYINVTCGRERSTVIEAYWKLNVVKRVSREKFWKGFLDPRRKMLSKNLDSSYGQAI